MVKKQRTLPQNLEESFIGMIIEEVDGEKEKEPETRYGKGYAPDVASPRTFQWIKDAGKEIFDIFGLQPYMIKDFHVYNSQKKRHWDRLAPDEELGNYFSTDVAQAVMERQDDDFDDEDIYIWIHDKFQDETGPLMDTRNPTMYNDVSEDWMITKKQEEIINDICIDARQWYQLLPLERRLNRLNKKSYAAHLVRRFIRKRAKWPERFLGPPPRGQKDELIVRRWEI